MSALVRQWPQRVGAACGGVGRRVAQWPLISVSACAALLLVCCVSWLRVHIETDQAAVWNSPTSPYAANERKYVAVFGRCTC
jgi:uncharacterized membrane protein YdfJ with MMPL/SSD domain